MKNTPRSNPFTVKQRIIIASLKNADSVRSDLFSPELAEEYLRAAHELQAWGLVIVEMYGPTEWQIKSTAGSKIFYAA